MLKTSSLENVEAYEIKTFTQLNSQYAHLNDIYDDYCDLYNMALDGKQELYEANRKLQEIKEYMENGFDSANIIWSKQHVMEIIRGGKAHG